MLTDPWRGSGRRPRMLVVRMALVLSVLLGAAAWPGRAQLISAGVKGGIPLGDAFSGTISGLKSDNLRYSVGPMLELNLPLGFGAEFNALFKKTEASAANTLGSFHSREFPLVAKYKFPGVLVRPYLAAGYNYRSLGDVVSFLRSIPARGSLIDKTSSHGVVVGAGFRVNAVAIKISPELRFTRWNNGGFTLADTALSRNQAELLIGITF